jgi:hypothetical protein
MKYSVFVLTAAFMIAGISSAAESGSATKVRRTADGHPDLSGTWSYATSLHPGSVKKVVNGKATFNKVDQTARHGNPNAAKGAQAWTPAPSYKPEFQAKVKYLEANESKVDAVFYCARPGVPRIGSPRRIIQSPGEMVFLYEDASGDTYRVIPTDGRPHRKDPNPSYYGDSVARWEGDTLVVDATNFVEDTWFGEDGYFHSDAMHVVERFWRDGENLIYQATVDDPKVLTAPWVEPPHVVKPSNEPLEESPACKEDDGQRLLNLDHHEQR